MAKYWDWSEAATDAEETRRQSLARQMLAKMEAEYDAAIQSEREAMQSLRGGTPWDAPDPGFYRSLPPETRMAQMWEAGALTPKNPNAGYGKLLEEVIRYPMEAGSRPRDTLLRAAQELTKGNYGDALGLAAAAPVSLVAPALAAGRRGDDDDWREQAQKLGIPESHILGIDIATDPTTYMGVGASKAVPRALSRADDLLQVLRKYGSQARYGRGVPTYLEDAAGNVLMRTRNSPGGVLGPLALPAP
jgi:hypothetical protein